MAKLSEKQQRFSLNVGLLIVWANAQGYGLTFGDAHRTEEAQARLVESGASQTMKSKHRDRLAVDFSLFLGGRYKTTVKAYAPLGAFWKSLDPDNVWGGDWEGFRDAGHFEYAG